MDRVHIPSYSINEFPLCGKLFARGKNVILMVPCDKLGRGRVLCQLDVANNPSGRRLTANERELPYRRPSLQMSVSSLLVTNSAFISCPKGHVTHGFLACDLPSACWLSSDAVQFASAREGRGIPSVASCPANMTSLPPSFPCASGVQRVPYTLVCDHRADCHDNSDEDFCQYAVCSESASTCDASKQVRSTRCKLSAYYVKTFKLRSDCSTLKKECTQRLTCLI